MHDRGHYGIAPRSERAKEPPILCAICDNIGPSLRPIIRSSWVRFVANQLICFALLQASNIAIPVDQPFSTMEAPAGPG
eukprot:scaffold2771_cov252-Pinguiococcus_pyrenoidosus.AAC.40